MSVPPSERCAFVSRRAHRPAARRQRPHGAVQLAARAGHQGHVCPPHRGHRRRAVDPRSEATISMICAGWGSSWDEGLDAGGGTARIANPSGCASSGPRRRADVEGAAYRCFCSAEQLEADRKPHSGGASHPYSGRCRGVTRDEARRRIETASRRPSASACPTSARWFRGFVRGDVRFNTE